ncbi:MAG: RNA methyltransferase [Proteobacteria bacterium]|nr:RNA methyltransferase [Pseudomonadota bacterium]
MMKLISSVQNETIKNVIKLREDDFFWWEGYNFYNEIIKEKIEVEILFVEEEFYLKKLGNKISLKFKDGYLVSKRVFQKLSFTRSPQWIGGMIRKPSYRLDEVLKKGENFFYLAGLQDPGNVGAIVRIADAFSFDGIVFEKRGVSPYNEKSVRASAGSILRVPCLEGDTCFLYKFREEGYRIFFLTTSTTAKKIVKVRFGDKNVFVLGQEGQGIDFDFEGKEDIAVPMKRGVDSLNVSVTAGIVAFYKSLEVSFEKD